MFNEDSSLSLCIYIWSLTHGGGAARPRNEYRIQLTGVDFPLEEIRASKTLLLGWHESLKVFAGFDVGMHRTSRSRSPSVQVYLETLQNAAREGFSFQRKGNDEIAVAFTPGLFAEYAMQQDSLHAFAGDAAALHALDVVAAEDEVPDEVLNPLPAERQVVVRSIAVKKRANDFRERVVVAYEHHCAMCDLQLELIEAAHIIPVKSPESNDLTCNGMGLCNLHHKAYDKGLLGVNEDYRVVSNDRAIRRLDRKSRTVGLEGFLEALRPEIRLPDLVADQPRPEYLRRGLELRGWV